MSVELKIGFWLLFLVLVLWAIFRKRVKKVPVLSSDSLKVLEKHVLYYRHLSAEKKTRFQKLVESFLSDVKITGVGVEVDQTDRILVAASAVIPVMGFPSWTRYPHLTEVLLYPDRFDHLDYRTEGAERHTLGMVGWGVMQGKVVLSKPALHQGFKYADRSNVGIHEFVHLIDMMDGYTDGVPSYLIRKPQHMPWIKLVYNEIASIKSAQSEINPYGASSESEFFAVVSEYFFETPHLLERNHPELYRMLVKIFNQKSK